MESLLPFGIYTIPEISTVGRNEEELTDDAVPYVVGLARYREIARGQISGDTHGMLKLLVAPDSRKVLGVHMFGSAAAELVHMGQGVIGTRGHDRLPDRHGVQLPDVRRGLQGGRARCDESAERAERGAQGRVASRSTGRLAQLVRAPALHAGSPGFESLTAHQERAADRMVASLPGAAPTRAAFSGHARHRLRRATVR